MTRTRVTTVAGTVLGVVLVVLGVAETVRAVTSGDGGIPFWFGSLVGGGSLVLVGTRVRRRRPSLALAQVVVGGTAGAMATAWTVVGPLLCIGVIVLVRTDTQRGEDERLDLPRPTVG